MSKVTLPFWCVDAFLYFLMDNGKDLSDEMITRIGAFVEAYVLYDVIVLPERYRNEEDMKVLDTEGTIFQFFPSCQLIHSDDLANGISFDIDLAIRSYEELKKENEKWMAQHNPSIPSAAIKEVIKASTVTMADLRLWQWSLCNEIADKTGSSTVLPLSLARLSDLSPHSKRPRSFTQERLRELEKHYRGAVRFVSQYEDEPYTGVLENVPPFLALMIDQSQNRQHAKEVLLQLRYDYATFRDTSSRFRSELNAAQGLRNKKAVLDLWNNCWEILARGNFRKPRLIKRRISSEDITKAILKPSERLPIFFKHFLDYLEESRHYKRFRVYSELYNELDRLGDLRKKLTEVFGVRKVVPIKP